MQWLYGPAASAALSKPYRKLGSFSFYFYDISLAANCIFLAVFGLSLTGFIGVGVYQRTTGRGQNMAVFTVAMCVGALCEIVGYAGRILSWKDMTAEGPFLTQIIGLTIGPAFTAAGIYLCLRRLVERFGAEGSLVRPRWYTHAFIACDVVSLALQGAGGGMAAAALRAGRDKRPGTRVMVAGLAFQVCTLFVFLALAGHFAVATWRRHRRGPRGVPVVEVDRATLRLRRARHFRAFLAALLLSAVCLLWRCAFRAAELSDGWSGPLMRRQDLFIAFEGVMVAVAMLALNVFHPGLCMSEEAPESGHDVEPGKLDQ